MTGKNYIVLKAFSRILILMEKDIQRGIMNEHFEPTNHSLPTKEFEQCWKYLTGICMLAMTKAENSSGECFFRNDDELYMGWQLFLMDVKKFIKHGLESKRIEKIIKRSGIPEETLVKFLEALII